MKINSPDYYKLRAITLTNKYKKWENSFRKTFNLTDTPFDTASAEFWDRYEGKNYPFIFYDPTEDYTFDKNEAIRSTAHSFQEVYLIENKDQRKNIEAMLQSSGIAIPSEWLIRTVLYHVLFGTFNSPFTGLIDIKKDATGAIQMMVDQNISKKEWDTIWLTVKQYRDGNPNTPKSVRASKDIADFEREREWETFERDVETYLLYKKFQQNSSAALSKYAGKIHTPSTGKPSKSLYTAMLESEELAVIESKYAVEVDEKTLSVAISRCNKILKDLELF